jgi:peptide/nickel transport system substrate-binding protein
MQGYSFENLENLIKETANKDAIEFEKNPAYKFAKYFNSTEISRSPLGSGPYIFKEWVTDDKIVLERNPDYWGYKAGITEKGYVEKFVHKTVKDYDAALTGIKAGELDVLRGLPMEKYKHQTNSKKIMNNFKKELFYIPSYGYIGWNMKNPLFKSKKVRRAMTQLLDREQILETLFYGEAQVCKSPIYFKRPEYHSEITPLPFNTDRAKELLYEEGWIDTDGDGILDKVIDGKKVSFEFTVLSNSGNEVRKQIGLILAENCRKVGIKVDVQQLEWSIFLDQVHAQKFEAIILGWVMPITHPDPYQIWHSSQSKGEGSNYVSFINKRADELIEKNRQEFDMNKRIEYMREFQEILHEEQPYTFVYVTKSNMLFHKRFSDAKIYPYRPGYDPFEWWVPSTIQKYTVAN